jgi:hypothetical protein
MFLLMSFSDIIFCDNNLPYAPAGRHMAPETKGCLYAYGGGACAPMAMGGIPPESQFSWLSGSYLIMSF